MMAQLFVGSCDRCEELYHDAAAPIQAGWSEVRVHRLNDEAGPIEARAVLCAACTVEFKRWFEGEVEYV